MNSQRFFIALVPPPEIQAAVDDIKAYFKQQYGASKAFNSPPHITLQAPFEWSKERALDELTAGLNEFATGRHEVAIALRNFGAFPPKVIYVDVIHNPALMALQKDLARFMEVNYGIIDRRYNHFCPHMTVAFRDLTKAAFEQAWPEFVKKKIAFDFTAQKMTLLHHNGQKWQVYQDYFLHKTMPSANSDQA
ncbi:MAG: 2'-5' RNA ligase family protein [Leptolyngbyaceae cyanobacterium MAG.088]|nr:2'-5' RNA ligase family protein [Leptolyngbyaceae cyanobacterium MAG.088]